MMGNFADALRRVIDLKGWTQVEAAKFLAIAQPTLSLYLNGLRQPSVATLLKIAEAVGVSLEELTENQGYKISLVKENGASYHAPNPLRAAMAELNRRWRMGTPAQRQAIEVDLRRLFPRTAGKLLFFVQQAPHGTVVNPPE